MVFYNCILLLLENGMNAAKCRASIVTMAALNPNLYATPLLRQSIMCSILAIIICIYKKWTFFHLTEPIHYLSIWYTHVCVHILGQNASPSFIFFCLMTSLNLFLKGIFSTWKQRLFDACSILYMWIREKLFLRKGAHWKPV